MYLFGREKKIGSVYKHDFYEAVFVGAEDIFLRGKIFEDPPPHIIHNFLTVPPPRPPPPPLLTKRNKWQPPPSHTTNLD